jgi:hypothetical protein
MEFYESFTLFYTILYEILKFSGFVVVFPIPAIPKPVFRYLGLYNTGKYRQHFAGITGIRTYKMGTFDQNYYLLKNILSNIHLIYFGFTCKPAFILAYLSNLSRVVHNYVVERGWSGAN